MVAGPRLPVCGSAGPIVAEASAVPSPWLSQACGRLPAADFLSRSSPIRRDIGDLYYLEALSQEMGHSIVPPLGQRAVQRRRRHSRHLHHVGQGFLPRKLKSSCSVVACSPHRRGESSPYLCHQANVLCGLGVRHGFFPRSRFRRF